MTNDRHEYVRGGSRRVICRAAASREVAPVMPHEKSMTRSMQRKCPVVLLLMVGLLGLAALLPGEDIAITTLAGPTAPWTRTDGAGASYVFPSPWGAAFDGNGNLYVTGGRDATVRKITPGGIVSIMAGSSGQSGQADGVGSAARFTTPTGICVDAAGTVYVTDGNLIRRISSSQVVTTLAGSVQGSADGTGVNASFKKPSGISVDNSGNLYVADSGNGTIRRVTSSGVVTTLAGSPGSLGNVDGTGSAARFKNPYAIAIAPSGVLYVADAATHTIRSVTTGGVVATLAGLANSSGSSDGTGSAARFYAPSGITVDSSGKIWVADSGNYTIRTITASGVVTTVAGTVGRRAVIDGTGALACFEEIAGLAAGNDGTVSVVEALQCVVRRVTAAGVVTTWIGTPASGYVDGTGAAARFNFGGLGLSGIALDAGGNMYLADTVNCVIRKVTAAGVVTTVAGSAGAVGSTDGTGSAARFNQPTGIVADGSGGIYIADSGNFLIRRMTSAGVVTTVAGSAGQSGTTDGTGAAARFVNPTGICRNSSGALFVSDGGAFRKITSTGVVTTQNGVVGSMNGMVVDGSGYIFGVCSDVSGILKLTTAGVSTVFAGGPNSPGGIVDGVGTAASFTTPNGIGIDTKGNFFVTDLGCIRHVTAAAAVTTVAGNGTSSTFDGVGAAATINLAGGMVADGAGHIYFVDQYQIRMGTTLPIFTAQPVDVTTVAGQTASYTVAMAGLLPQTYQWSKSTDGGSTWTSISGATGTNYTTGVLALADSGKRYRCVATNGVGSTTSNVAALTVSNTAPVITVPAAASPAAVTAKTTALSVTATDDGGASALIYTWSYTGPSGVTYSANGTNAARASTATFTQYGTYNFTVDVKDGMNLHAYSSVTVQVKQTATAIVVTPTPINVVIGKTQDFAAVQNDQFGNAMAAQPTFTWTQPAAAGTWTTSGATCRLVASLTTGGAYTLKAAVGAMSGTSSITVINGAPTVATPASASPNPVTGETAALSVLGNDDGDESNLIYSWTTTSGTPAPTITPSGTNAAKSASAKFTKAGTFTIKATIQDKGTTPKSVTSTITNLVVAQTVSSVVISNGATSVRAGASTPAFTASALDQFTNAMSVQPTIVWDLPDGGGSVSAGVVTAGFKAGAYRLRATATGGVAGTVGFTVTDAPPTIGTAPTATLKAGLTTATLSVVGAHAAGESTLLYTWEAIGTLPAPVTFSAGGTNAAKSVTATFTIAGGYDFQVTIVDQCGQSVAGTVHLDVPSYAVQGAVTPANLKVPATTTRQYAITTVDQFGMAMSNPPAPTWSVISLGSISLSGLFSPGANNSGSSSIKAQWSVNAAGTLVNYSATTTAYLGVNQAPTIATPAAISPNPIVAGTGACSVLGADDVGEPYLTYAWTVVSGPAAVAFSTTGTNSAKNVQAVFTKTGQYTLRATVSDESAQTAWSDVTVNVTGLAPMVPDQTYGCDGYPASVQRKIRANTPAGASLVFTIASQPGHGTATLASGDPASFVYTPASGFTNGKDTFTITAFDGTTSSPAGTVTIMVGVDPTRSLLVRAAIAETFDSAAWSANPSYRASYVGQSMPGRVWMTATGASGAPMLQIIGQASIPCALSGTAVAQAKSVAGAPITFTVTGNGSFGGMPSITVQADATGLATATFTGPPNQSRCPILIGSPLAVGTQRVVMEVKP